MADKKLANIEKRIKKYFLFSTISIIALLIAGAITVSLTVGMTTEWKNIFFIFLVGFGFNCVFCTFMFGYIFGAKSERKRTLDGEKEA